MVSYMLGVGVGGGGVIQGFHSGFRHGPMDLEKLEKPCKKVVFMLLFHREIQGIKWKNGNFLI